MSTPQPFQQEPARELGDPASRATCTLRQMDGGQAGQCWPITAHTTLIGRGSGCVIRVESPWVSRVHCEVILEQGQPRVINRSKSSKTLVNGIPCEETVLRDGDVLEVPGTQFLVVAGAELPAALTGAGSQTPPTAQHFHESIFLNTVPEGDSAQLRALFDLLRQVAQAEGLDRVAAILVEHLEQRFAPGRLWIAWRVRPDGEVSLYPPSLPQEEHLAPLGLIRDACRLRQGLLAAPGTMGRDASTIVAPLIAQDAAYGALALERPAGFDAYTEAELGYLLAVAEPVAPWLHAVERLEQFERDENSGLAPRSSERQMVGSSETLMRVKQLLRQAAGSKAHLLLLGETGVGKELAARMVHDLSARASGPYVVVNCAALPAEIFESEMFGHEKGAFTGAFASRKGLLEQAHGGTLFLDEVGDLSRSNQARMLRAVETGNFRRLGAATEIHVDVRIISATNQPLAGQADFRNDLYHRIAGIVVELPPLRERRGDIPELAYHFLRSCASNARLRPVSFSASAMGRLVQYDWPGNIRELRNVVERATLTCTTQVIDAVDVPELSPVQKKSVKTMNEIVDVERQHLEHALTTNGGNVRKAALALGIPKSTLYYKLAKLGIKTR
ncbi:MAG: sigma 54-interacting transcriptional regulator [Candidatus Hydrogenedentes bacterium]|nr:sigma 54-interacting transcriptional regulator [Candidatus Hydrogenedentota bacterium]